jgi:hypothetical protein
LAKSDGISLFVRLSQTLPHHPTPPRRDEHWKSLKSHFENPN